jgi:hypothetical protein
VDALEFLHGQILQLGDQELCGADPEVDQEGLIVRNALWIASTEGGEREDDLLEEPLTTVSINCGKSAHDVYFSQDSLLECVREHEWGKGKELTLMRTKLVAG